jgi:hypothetical protein
MFALRYLFKLLILVNSIRMNCLQCFEFEIIINEGLINNFALFLKLLLSLSCLCLLMEWSFRFMPWCFALNLVLLLQFSDRFREFLTVVFFAPEIKRYHVLRHQIQRPVLYLPIYYSFSTYLPMYH